MYEVAAKKGRAEVGVSNSNIILAIARDEGRIYSRLGASWIDLTPQMAQDLAAALLLARDDAMAGRKEET